MIRVSPRPRTFGGELSAYVRESQDFLQICVCWPHISGSRRCCGWACVSPVWTPAFHGVECKYSGDNSCGISNDKACVWRLWDACHATAQWPVDWRLAAGRANATWCVCVAVCHPSKQYKPHSTIFFVRESDGGTINALIFSTTCSLLSRLLEVLCHRPSCILSARKNCHTCFKNYQTISHIMPLLCQWHYNIQNVAYSCPCQVWYLQFHKYNRKQLH